MMLHLLQSLLDMQLVVKQLFQSSTQLYIESLNLNSIGPVWQEILVQTALPVVHKASM